jgi:hypothetical protein
VSDSEPGSATLSARPIHRLAAAPRDKDPISPALKIESEHTPNTLRRIDRAAFEHGDPIPRPTPRPTSPPSISQNRTAPPPGSTREAVRLARAENDRNVNAATGPATSGHRARHV